MILSSKAIVYKDISLECKAFSFATTSCLLIHVNTNILKSVRRIDMLNLAVISKKITDKRKQIGMTQNELADALFVTRQAVSKWEMGYSLPSLEILISLTKLFNISIDYLLDGSEVTADDYQTMFMQYPRESVIYQFLSSEKKDQNIKNFFYLLKEVERKQIIDQLVSRQISLDMKMLWPVLSMKERKYIIANQLSKNIGIDLECVFDMMSNEEKMMVKQQLKKRRINNV